MNAREGHVFRILGLAQSQYEMFNIKMNTPGVTRNGLSAMLHAIDQKGLQDDCSGLCYRRLGRQTSRSILSHPQSGRACFYVFSSKILKIHPDYENSTLVCQVPENLRVEKNVILSGFSHKKRYQGNWRMAHAGRPDFCLCDQ